MTSSVRYIACFALCLAFCVLGRPQAQTPDSSRHWMTVGSDGTVDEADVRKVFFNNSIVQMGQPLGDTIKPSAAKLKAAAPAAGKIQSAVIRYNITPVDGLFPTSQVPTFVLTLRYLDDGSSGQVVAKLIQVDLASGSEKVRVIFDSNAFEPSAKYQVRKVEDCSRQPFDFVRNAYYIEATLTARTSTTMAGSAAGIQIIKIESGGCPFS